MKKVLVFELADSIGGIETFLLTMINNISGEIKYDFVSSCDNFVFKEELKEKNVNVFLLPNKKNFLKYKKELKKIDLKSYDFFYFNKNSLADSNAIRTVIKYKKESSKIILHSHNTAPSTSSFLLKFLHKFNRKSILKKINLKIACSNEARLWMFGNDEDVVFIPNGIDVDRFIYNVDNRKLIRKELNIGDDEFCVGHVGAFKKQKNHYFILDIIKLCKNFFPCKFILVGSGPLYEDVVSKAKELELMDCIRFMGSRKDVDRIYSAMDCFILPSLYEGLPISALEAQDNGLPIILSNVISNETVVSSNVYKCSIDDSKKWVDLFIKISESNQNNRLLGYQDIKNSIFNSNNSIEILKHIFGI